MATTPLIASLVEIRRKVKALGIILGAGIVLASLVGVLLGTVLLDYTLNLPTLPRLVVMLLALCAVGATVFHQLIRPVLKKLSISDVAGRLENAFPSFDDRLRSTVDFVQGRADGSEIMKNRVIEQAGDLARQIDLNRAIVLKPVIYSISGGVGALVLAIALAMTSPTLARTALARLFTPFSATSWPKRVQIQADPLPRRIPVGQAVTVKMKLIKGDRPSQRAVVYYQSDNGIVQRAYMTRSGDSFTASFDAKGQQMKIWIQSGDDQTSPANIDVVQRLQIERIEAQIAPPAYAKLPPVSINLSDSAAMATVGSNVLLKISFNKPLDSSREIVLEQGGVASKLPARVTWNRASAAQPQAAWNIKDSLRFRVKAIDTDGFANSALQEYEIMARADQLPSVQIEEPRGSLDLTPTACPTLRIVAEDDFGIEVMKLVVDRVGTTASTQPSATTRPAAHWEIPLTGWQTLDGSAGRLRFGLAYDWELARTLMDATGASIQPGDMLEYYVAVKDNFDLPDGDDPAAPHQTHPFVASGKLRIHIISQGTLDGLVTERLHAAMSQIDDAYKAQQSVKAQTQTLAQETKDKPQFGKPDHEAAQQLADQQSTLASQTRQIAEQMESIEQQLAMNRSPRKDLSDLARQVKQDLNQIAEHPMSDSLKKLNEAMEHKSDPKPGESQKQRSAQRMEQSLSNARDSQQQAADQLKMTRDKLGAMATLAEVKDAWQAILEEQRKINDQFTHLARKNVSKKPEEMKPEDRDRLNELAQQQRQAAADVDKAIAKTREAAAQMQKSDPASSQTMKDAAQQATSAGISTSQQQASSQIADNQPTHVHVTQQQIELGLRTVLDTLNQAEQHRLAELAKQLDDLEESIKSLIRHQAGHNIDTLSMIRGDARKLIGKELLDDAQRSGTEAAKAVVPTATQLTEAQAQTEHNTRDAAQRAETLSDSAGPAASLTAAAGKMGYAITNLRDAKPQDAYEPYQTGALSLLKDALKQVQDLRQDTIAQIQQKQREAIRDAYIKIRDEQLAQVNLPTQGIHAAPRDADGRLSRAQEQALNKLPGVQGGLAARMEKVGKDLDEIDSDVYLWANDDVFKTMSRIKDDLHKGQTGAATQAEQGRVVEQLTAMIDDLATRPEPGSQFVPPRHPDGRPDQVGNPPPKVPSEAELRLLKSLEAALANATRQAAALPENQRDPAKLTALGERQASLRDLLGRVARKSGAGDIGPGPDKNDEAPAEPRDAPTTKRW